MTQSTVEPVRKSIIVRADPARAFKVFTEDFDSWWPREHHIGNSPMTRGVIEPKAGGRLYNEQQDGTECDWGKMLVWDPPHRFVWAWMITADWKYQPDLAQSSEVEVRFTAVPGGTRVDLEHRHLERHGAGAAQMRAGIDSPQGWGFLMEMYGKRVERES